MNYVLVTSLPMMVCLFWMVTLGLDYQRKRRVALLCLAVFMMTAALLYQGHFVYFNQYKALIPLSDTVYRMANLSVFPLYLIYIIEVTTRRPQRLHYALFLAPALVGGMAVGQLYYMMSPAETNLFIDQYLYGANPKELNGLAMAQYATHRILDFVFGVQVLVVLFASVYYIRRFRSEVRSYYADTEGRMLVGIHAVLVVLAVTSFVSFVSNIIGRQAFAQSALLLALPAFGFGGLLYAVGYLGMTQDFTIRDIPESAPVPAPARKLQTLYDKIDQLMMEQQLYLKTDLKVSDLAKLLNTNEKYVSQSINVVLGQPFAEYVNRLRIGHACRLMEQNPDMMITEVAQQSGYAVVSSFYRNLKLYGKRKD